MYIGALGEAVFLTGDDAGRQSFLDGDMLIVPGGTLCGVESGSGAVYTEIIIKKEINMNNLKFITPQEREAYRIGYECGRQEGLKKASLLIQLVASDSNDFKESILQNSKEAVEMIRILTGKGE